MPPLLGHWLLGALTEVVHQLLQLTRLPLSPVRIRPQQLCHVLLIQEVGNCQELQHAIGAGLAEQGGLAIAPGVRGGSVECGASKVGMGTIGIGIYRGRISLDDSLAAVNWLTRRDMQKKEREKTAARIKNWSIRVAPPLPKASPNSRQGLRDHLWLGWE